jgi:REP element-mobilizing transposase RayT
MDDNNLNLFWYQKYKVDHEVLKNNYINDYIKRLINKTEDKNMETKISQIEKDYIKKIKDIEDLYNDSEKIKLLKMENSLIILQKELEIIKILTKYTLLNKMLNYDFFKICLTLLLNFSETLRLRLNQKEIIHTNFKNKNSEAIENIESNLNPIIRCSYKFCSYQDNCVYNYNLKSKNLCYQDHYVHNMVSADLKILLKYIIDKNKITKTILHTKEILKTINTLSYVISHMETELRTKCLYLPENQWETCHVIKNK